MKFLAKVHDKIEVTRKEDVRTVKFTVTASVTEDLDLEVFTQHVAGELVDLEITVSPFRVATPDPQLPLTDFPTAGPYRHSDH